MSRTFLCPGPEKTLPDGTRPGPCHVWGSCDDLNACEPRGRCQFGLAAATPTESED